VDIVYHVLYLFAQNSAVQTPQGHTQIIGKGHTTLIPLLYVLGQRLLDNLIQYFGQIRTDTQNGDRVRVYCFIHDGEMITARERTYTR